MLKIPDFTRREIEYIKENANFTERESALFDLRNKEIPHERCAELLHISVSTEKRASRKMLDKIKRIL